MNDMAHELVSVDVTNNPVLRALGEEVKRTGPARVPASRW